MTRNSLKSLFAATCIAVTFPSMAAAQETRTAPAIEAEDMAFRHDLETLVNDTLTRFDRVPGLAVAVTRSDGPVLVRGWGMADLERQFPATADTRYYIASTTKAYVGTALAVLDARGEIDLDWTLAELAPDVTFKPEVRANEVSLRHMISLQHGLRNDAIPFRLAYSGQADTQVLWNLLSQTEANPDAPLGTFQYNNLGFNLATLLIERRLGMRWQEILENEIFAPLGLRQTHAQGLIQARKAAQFAAPYQSLHPDGTELLYLEKHDDTMQSAGGLYSSANDMARWLQLQLSAASSSARTPLALAAAQAHHPLSSFNKSFGPSIKRTGYGLGWYSGPYRDAILYHAFGSFSGMRAHASFLPDHDLGVAVMVNDEGTGFMLADVIADFAYDWFILGPEQASGNAKQAMDLLSAGSARQIEKMRQNIAQRAERSWLLSLPASAYEGSYCNHAFGKIAVQSGDDGLFAQQGRLKAAMEPFTESDSARVELVPGSGQVIRFQIADGRVEGLQADGQDYPRCN